MVSQTGTAGPASGTGLCGARIVRPTLHTQRYLQIPSGLQDFGTRSSAVGSQLPIGSAPHRVLRGLVRRPLRFRATGLLVAKSVRITAGGRRAEQITLQVGAAHLRQHPALLFGFHALGDDAQAEGLAQTDHSGDDGRGRLKGYR